MQNEPIIITTSSMSNDDAISWMREKIKAADDLQALYAQEELLDLKLMKIRAQIDECVDLCSIEIQSSN